MSLITDIVVVTAGDEDEAIATVNTAMRIHMGAEFPNYYALRPVGGGGDSGGSKVASARVYGGSFNYLPHAEFREAIQSAPWRFPGHVLAWIDSEIDEDGPAIVRVSAQSGALPG